MILVKGRIGSRDILFKVFRSRVANKPAYIVRLTMDGQYAVERRQQGQVSRAESDRIIAAIPKYLPHGDTMVDAIEALRTGGVNIAFAPAMVYASLLGKGDTDIVEWIASLAEKHREEATRAHGLLTATGILIKPDTQTVKGDSDG